MAATVKTSTPGVYRRGSRYVIGYRFDGRQRWETFRTLDEARRAKRAREAATDAGLLITATSETVHDYARQWIANYVGRTSRGFREQTRKGYSRQLETYLLRFFPEGRKLRDVKPEEIRAFVGWLCDERIQGRRLTDATVTRIMAPVKAMFADAYEDGVIAREPTRHVRLPNRQASEPVEDEPVKAMTRAELAAFMDACPEDWRTFFHFLAVTGVRISEALALQWRHVEPVGRQPHVKIRQRIVKGELGAPKSRHGRRDIPIPDDLALALIDARRLTEWPQDTDYVFSSMTGAPFDPGNVFGRVLRPTGAQAGVPWVGFHTFRHTCASLLIAVGRNILQVSRWLGHGEPGFTLRQYGHLMDEGVGAPLSLPVDNGQGANNVQTHPTPTSTTRRLAA